MDKDILNELGMKDREEVVVFLKRLWLEKETPCPRCGAILTFMHKKAKKSNCDWKCPECQKVYKTIDILKRVNEE